MKSLTVVCPVYNEEEIIERFYRELAAVLDSLRDRYESHVVFVVDRSTDGTLAILKSLAAQDPRVRILALSSRFGHQTSLLAGIDHADGDAIVMLDSDLQHPPELIPSMLDEFERGFDVVYTVRRDHEVPMLRRLTSRLFYRVVNTMSQVPIQESAADFRLISRRVADVFRNQLREQNPFLRGLVSWVGFRRVGITFDTRSRAAGRSKYSPGRLVAFATQGVVSFSKRPLHAAVVVGSAFALFGLLVALQTLVQWFYSQHLPSGWTTLVILISGFSGIQLIFLGIIGQYIGAIFDEVKGRPHYIIEEKVNVDRARGDVSRP